MDVVALVVERPHSRSSKLRCSDHSRRTEKYSATRRRSSSDRSLGTFSLPVTFFMLAILRSKNSEVRPLLATALAASLSFNRAAEPASLAVETGLLHRVNCIPD